MRCFAKEHLVAEMKPRNWSGEAGCAETRSSRAAVGDTEECGEALNGTRVALGGEGPHLRTRGRQ